LSLVEAEDGPGPADEDGPFDQIRLGHHEVDRFLLRRRQRTRLEGGAAPAHEIEKVVLVDVPLEERAIGWLFVDVAFFDADTLLLQITSGVAAGGSSRFPVEDGLRHEVILTLP